MLLHHISLKEKRRLEHIFAYLTPEGWKLPAWLELLNNTPRNR